MTNQKRMRIGTQAYKFNNMSIDTPLSLKPRKREAKQALKANIEFDKLCLRKASRSSEESIIPQNQLLEPKFEK